jgi:hypothetical protein
MNLQGRELRPDDQGDDVALLQRELTTIGHRIDPAELAEQSFGRTTRRAVQEVQERAGLAATGVVDERTAAAINDAAGHGGPVEPPRRHTVRGRVLTDQGVTLPGTEVEAVDVGLAGETMLGRTAAGDGGAYLIGYDPAAVAGRGKAAPDILVRALRADGGVAATSAVRYNAPAEVEIDVVVPAGNLGLPDEYTRLTGELVAQLPPAAGPTRLAELQEGDGRIDITYLANKTGWDARMVAMAALSDRLAEETDIPAPFHYALLRAGLPADGDVLFQADPAVVRATWDTAIKEQRIPEDLADQVDAVAERFQTVAAERLLNKTPRAGASRLSAVLEVAGLDQQAQARVVQLYNARRGDPGRLWTEITAELGEDTTRMLQLNGKLAFLTINNAPLLTALRDQLDLDDPVALVREGFFRPERWSELLVPDVPVPAAVPGDDDAQRRANYAELMADQLRVSYPTAVVAERVRSLELPVPAEEPVREEVYQFLSANQGAFELGVHPVDAFLRDTGTALSDQAAGQVRLLQRVYQLSPSDQAMAGLLTRGLDSAHAIAQYDQGAFVRLFSGELGGEPAAKLAHAKAMQVRGTLVSLITSYLAGRVEPEVAALPREAVATADAPAAAAAAATGVLAYPTLEGLFGAMDFCACPHCRSVLGPAAYLVDLLESLDLRRHNAAGAELPPSYVGANPADVLLARRPDLAHTQLTCENTNTVLPTVDLVNELLEHLVANNLTVAGFTGHNVQEGVDVAAESADLLADPRYVDTTAYTALADAAYPLVLPFHRALAELRAYLNGGGVALADAMIAVRASDAAAPPGGAPATAYGWRDVSIERLGMTRREHALLTNATIDLRELYGADPATTSVEQLVAAMSNAVAFARAFSLDYEDVIELTRTRFVNPAAELLPKLERLRVSFADIKRLHDGALTAAEFSALLPDDLDPTPYGGDVIAWVTSQFDALMGLIVLRDPSGTATVCGFDRLEFRRVDPDMATNRIDAVTLLRLVRLVRLRARLGWTFAQTDTALAALWPAARQPAPADTPQQALGKLDAGMAEVIVRLGHLKALLEALKVRPARELGLLLGCWAPLDTYGPDAPYRRLLLGPAGDPAFAEDGFGRFPNPAGDPKLAAHAEALRAAAGVTAAQFGELLDALGYDDQTPLSLETISAVLRRAFLARKLRMSPGELAALTALSGIDPFEPLSDLAAMPPRAGAPGMARFVALAERLRAAGVRTNRLRYLLAHDDPAGTASPLRADVLAQVAVIRAELERIDADAGGATAADDPTAEAARAAMSLVYDADVVDTFFGLLLGTTTVSVPYAHAQAELPAAVTAAAPGLAYDDFTKRLSYQGVMTVAVRDAAVTAAGADQALADALGALHDAGQQQVADFFDRFPDLAGLYTAYADSTAPQPARLAALLADFLPALRDRLKRAYLRQTLATETGWTAAEVAGVIEDPAVLHAVDQAQPAIADLLGVGARGLTARYWLAADTAGPPAQTVPAVAGVDYADGSPVALPQRPGDPTATVSGDWRGYLAAPDNGLYILSVLADDSAAVTLRLDGQPIALTPAAAGTGRTEWRNQQPVELAAGVLRELRLTVTGVRSRLALRWQAKGLARAPVPAGALYPRQAVDAFAATHLRLLKAAAVTELAHVGPAELRWSATRPEYAVAGRSWLDALPTQPASDAAVVRALFDVANDLLGYAALRDDLDVPGDLLLRVLTDPAATGPDGRPLRAALRGWDEAGLASLLTRFGLTQADLRRVQALARVVAAFAVAARLGVATTVLLRAVTNQPDDAAVSALRAALRARHDAADWRTLLQPISDDLRARRRDALVGQVLHGLAATPATAHVDTADKLYEHLLIDVATDPCTRTSRIRQAIATVQLFTQRCLLHLEPEVDPSSIDAERWEWMKRYRVWEANRKVFLYPENWLEPALRDDKSPFFRDLESALLGADLTDDAAARSLGTYLDQLADVAQLEASGIYLEQNDLGVAVGTADDVAHLVARTAGAKRRYYYRRNAGAAWTPWERIGIDIPDNPVLPVVWRGRTLLFWLGVNAEAQPVTGPPGDASAKLTDLTVGGVRTGVGGQVNQKVILYWSEYTDGKWQPPATSDVNNPLILGPLDPGGFDRTKIAMFASLGIDGELWVDVLGQGYGGTFILFNTHSVPARLDEQPYGPNPTYPSLIARQRFLWPTPGLAFTYYDPFADERWFSHDVLARAPLRQVVEPLHRLGDAFSAPFVLQDRRYAFWVRPVVSSILVPEWEEPYVPEQPPPTVVIPDLGKVFVVGEVPVPIDPRPPFSPEAFRAEVINPSPIRAVVMANPNIRTALEIGDAVRIDGVDIGPGGALRAVPRA